MRFSHWLTVALFAFVPALLGTHCDDGRFAECKSSGYTSRSDSALLMPRGVVLSANGQPVGCADLLIGTPDVGVASTRLTITSDIDVTVLRVSGTCGEGRDSVIEEAIGRMSRDGGEIPPGAELVGQGLTVTVERGADFFYVVPQDPGEVGRVSAALEVAFDGESDICDPTGASIDLDTVPAVCGNGILEDDVESCDDGNSDPGDGCDETCSMEQPYCEGAPADQWFAWICDAPGELCQQVTCNLGDRQAPCFDVGPTELAVGWNGRRDASQTGLSTITLGGQAESCECSVSSLGALVQCTGACQGPRRTPCSELDVAIDTPPDALFESISVIERCPPLTANETCTRELLYEEASIMVSDMEPTAEVALYADGIRSRSRNWAWAFDVEAGSIVVGGTADELSIEGTDVPRDEYQNDGAWIARFTPDRQLIYMLEMRSEEGSLTVADLETTESGKTWALLRGDGDITLGEDSYDIPASDSGLAFGELFLVQITAGGSLVSTEHLKPIPSKYSSVRHSVLLDGGSPVIVAEINGFERENPIRVSDASDVWIARYSPSGERLSEFWLHGADVEAVFDFNPGDRALYYDVHPLGGGLLAISGQRVGPGDGSVVGSRESNTDFIAVVSTTGELQWIQDVTSITDGFRQFDITVVSDGERLYTVGVFDDPVLRTNGWEPPEPRWPPLHTMAAFDLQTGELQWSMPLERYAACLDGDESGYVRQGRPELTAVEGLAGFQLHENICDGEWPQQLATTAFDDAGQMLWSERYGDREASGWDWRRDNTGATWFVGSTLSGEVNFLGEEVDSYSGFVVRLDPR